jgi:aspartate dehydrogenase
MATRVGIIGFGYVGSYLYEQIVSNPAWGLDVAFVWPGRNRDASLPAEILLRDLAQAGAQKAEVIVEAAHAQVTREHGISFLRHAHCMPLSTTALADEALEQAMREAAEANGTCLYVPHGAAVGLDSLSECRDLWENVTVTMRKNPANIDFADAPDFRGKTIGQETLLYDGPTRGVCRMFPRNVNAHAAVALAGIGFDITRSVFIADPSLDVSVIELQASGGGIAMDVRRSNPLKGVSGVMTLRSILGSLQRATAPGVHFKVV